MNTNTTEETIVQEYEHFLVLKKNDAPLVSDSRRQLHLDDAHRRAQLCLYQLGRHHRTNSPGALPVNYNTYVLMMAGYGFESSVARRSFVRLGFTSTRGTIDEDKWRAPSRISAANAEL